MTKKEIIEIVTRWMIEKGERIDKNHLRGVIECVLEAFIDLLASDGRIEIRGFGIFKIKKTPARVGRNPVTKEEAKVPARNIVQFKAGRYMIDAVNRE
ncbi:MAG: HU family DNA-binding protein [Candidatus Omnitrophota bacterium]